ncbi:MAG TPA: alpha/beta hydrolase [Rhizomicrobium sp.]|nr:alpha/beta hydrolase [Rhizomicrobium sp.]
MTLVLLPGMLCDAAFWRAQIEAFGDTQVIGFGTRDDFDAMAERVLAEAPARFALAGHSMGGRVALEVMRRAPERVARLALVATDYRGHPDDASYAAEEARRSAILGRIAAAGMRGFAQGWAAQVIARENMEDAVLVSDVVEMMARHAPEVAAAQTLAGLKRRDQSDVLASVACPTLIVAGAEDALRPVAVHRAMAERVRHSDLVVVEGAAHMVAMERPAATISAMRNWLAH